MRLRKLAEAAKGFRLGMRRHEALQSAAGSEALHCSFSFSKRQMAVFGPIIGAFVGRCSGPGATSRLAAPYDANEVPPENWTLTQTLICCLLIFTTKEIEDVETKSACP